MMRLLLITLSLVVAGCANTGIKAIDDLKLQCVGKGSDCGYQGKIDSMQNRADREQAIVEKAIAEAARLPGVSRDVLRTDSVPLMLAGQVQRRLPMFRAAVLDIRQSASLPKALAIMREAAEQVADQRGKSVDLTISRYGAQRDESSKVEPAGRGSIRFGLAVDERVPAGKQRITLTAFNPARIDLERF